MRIIFMGTSKFSTTALKTLHHAGYTICAVYTSPPKKAGRGKQRQCSPIQKQAEYLSLPVLTPTTLQDTHVEETFSSHQADIAVVVAYGKILPQNILNIPKYGCLNIHASLLPRWRGAAPIQRAIMAGDSETGINIIQMDAELDTGHILYEEKIKISSQDTFQTLHDKLMIISGHAIEYSLKNIDHLSPIQQTKHNITYAHKINKTESRIDWSQNAILLERLIHGLSPFPGAWFEVDNKRIKVLNACAIQSAHDNLWGTILDEHLTIACGQGKLKLLKLQKSGKSAMDASIFQQGTYLKKGMLLL